MLKKINMQLMIIKPMDLFLEKTLLLYAYVEKCLIIIALLVMLNQVVLMVSALIMKFQMEIGNSTFQK